MKKKKAPQAAKPKAAPQKAAEQKMTPAKEPAVQPGAEQLPVIPALEKLDKKEVLVLCLFFLCAFVGTTITVGRVSTIMMLLCVIFAARKSSAENLMRHLSLPAVGMICMTLLYGISGIRSPFGQSVVQEFFRGMCYFSIAGFALLRFKKKHVPALLWGYLGVVGLLSFVSIDMAGAQILFKPLALVSEAWGADMSSFPMMSGTRISGLFNNSNVLAGMTGTALVVNLFQLHTLENKKHRLAASVLLGVNAMAFWLCVSRAAMLCFGISMVVYLLLTKKGERLELFLQMVLCVGVTVVLSTLALRFMGEQGGSIVADLLALACGPVILLINDLIVHRVSQFVMRSRKMLMAFGGAVGVLVVAAIVCVFTLKSSYTFGSEEMMFRGVDLEPGESYTVSGDWDGDFKFYVIVEGEKDLLMDWYDVVYEGPLDGAEFTLPEDTATVLLRFDGDPGETLHRVTMSDGTEVRVNLKLMPESLEARLADKMLTSSSLLLRAEYVKDGLKIWSTAPVFGRGLASTDNLYTSVQQAYYMSMFAHNHIIQYLSDLGLVGLAAFLLVVVGLAWLLIRKWRKDGDPMAAMFLTCLVMMNLHSAMEINFSIRAYAIMAYLLLAIMTIAYGEPLFIKGKKTLAAAAKSLTAVYLAALVVFAGCAIGYRVVSYKSAEFQTNSYEEFMDTLESFIKWDVFNDDYHKTLYVARGNGQPAYQGKVNKYAAELRASGLFTNCDAVARYYYLPNGYLDEVFVVTREAIAQKASDAVAWNAELDFYRARVLGYIQPDWENAMSAYLNGVLELNEYLVTYNQDRLEPIVLSEDNQAFLDTVKVIAATPDITPEEAYAMLDVYSYAESEDF